MDARGGAVALALALAACGGSNGGNDAGRDAATRDVDPRAMMREACAYGPGAMPSETVGDFGAARTAITHVMVVMQENHSWDHMFGTLGHGTEGPPAGYSNVDAHGAVITTTHLATACSTDPPHQWNDVHTQWNNGAMDGFAQVGGPDALGNYNDSDHPFYSWIATTFATSDRYFSSVLSGTWPNRDYLLCGTSNGVKATFEGLPNARTVFDQLDDAGVTWGAYVDNGDPFEGTLGWTATHAGVHSHADLMAALADGTLPAVTFVDAGPGLDEHPPANVRLGEQWTRSVVTAAFASPLWNHMAVFFTYDEHGGFYDHVPPPSACLASPSEREFDHLGVRVPFVVISPYARAGFVSHQTHSHTSILRFIQAVYELPALTGRDANSDALDDLFDWTAPAFATPPTDVPAAATGGC